MRKFLLAALSLLLAACNSTNVLAGLSQPTPAPPSAKMDTDFTANGRYIVLSQAPLGSSAQRGAGVKFYIKGIVYSPVPIDKGVGDPPILDNALRNGNQPIWSRDLPKMREMGANAIHVYNVVPPPYDKDSGTIDKFLNAAWNGGKKPVYVLMSIHFHGDKLYDAGAVADLATQYHDLCKKYSKYPAIFGVTISNEIGAKKFIEDPTWWTAFNVIAKAAKQGFADGGDPDKIVTTSEADGNIGAVVEGEKNNAAVDAWGINIYRGRGFTDLFGQIRKTTKKPVMMTEYGASTAYHPAWKNTYDWRNGFGQLGQCHPDYKNGPGNTDVKELPDKGDPGMAGLVDYVWNNNRWLASGFTDEGGLVSGGFYFEWSDEWWKAGNPTVHQGNDAFNGAFPGCSEDQAWYGLNAVQRGGGLDVLTPRPTLDQLKQSWKQAP